VAQFGHGLLSQTPALLWITALLVVLLFHCSHLFRMRGEACWYHSAHVVMLLGMLYMFSAPAIGLHFLPPRAWIIVYVATSVAILGWMLLRLLRRRSLGKLWAVAFIQQVAMIYMWAPMRFWLPLLTYGFVFYFVGEIIAWLANAYSKLEPLAVAQAHARHAGGSLEPRSVFGDLCMTTMAASMAYMFLAMQLMAPMPRHLEQLTESGPAAPPELAPPSYVAQPMPEPSSRAVAPPPSRAPETYEIVAGDTLRRIAARVYGRADLWARIAKANPGLDPRRLRVGQVIALPASAPTQR